MLSHCARINALSGKTRCRVNDERVCEGSEKQEESLLPFCRYVAIRS